MSKLTQAAKKILAVDIRTGEERSITMLLVHSFCMGLSLVYFETAAYALFLDAFEARQLPYVYMISAPVAALFGVIYSQLEGKLSLSRLFPLVLGLLLASVVIFYCSVSFVKLDWVRMGMLAWFNVMMILLNLEFWGLANSLLNVRQGRRLFGFIGGGEILAGILGGFSVSLLVELLGTENLLLFSGLGMVGCMASIFSILKAFGAKLGPRQEEERDNWRPRERISLKERYYILIVVSSILSVFGYYILDYLFYGYLETEFPSDATVAKFLGIFLAIVNAMTFLSRTFLHGRLINRFGIGMGLLVVPGAVAVGAVFATLARHSELILIFGIMVVTKGVDEILRDSIEEPTLRLLYQPFTKDMRIKAQTGVETMVEPLSGALAGGLLLWLASFLPKSALLYTLFGILIIWFFFAIALRKEYTEVMKRTLGGRQRGGIILDDSAIDALSNMLQSENPNEIINSLNMLEDADEFYQGKGSHLDAALIQLLEKNRHPDVLTRVLEKIGDRQLVTAAPSVLRLLDREINSEVIGMALRTLCVISDEGETIEKVFAYLEMKTADIKIRKGAMVGLLKNGGIDSVLNAGQHLNNLLDSENPWERKLAAEVLGEVGNSSFYRPLIKLMQDEDLEVTKAALQASVKLKNERFVPLLIKHFYNPQIFNAAVATIIEFGDMVLPALEAELDREDQYRSLRIRLIRTISRVGGRQAINILKKKINYSDEDIRTNILNALVFCKYNSEEEDEREELKKQIKDEVQDSTWTLSVIVDVGESPETELLIRALHREVERNQQRIFMMLALLYHRESILQAQKNLESTSKEMRANAVEVLDNLIGQDIKSFAFPMLDDIQVHQRHARLVSHFPQKRLTRHERLKEILGRSQQWTSPWTKTCALFTIGQIGTKEFYDSIIACFPDPDPVVRETAVWALGKLNPDDVVYRLQQLIDDADPRVSRRARFVINYVGFSSVPIGKGYLTRSGRYTADLFVNILHDEGERRVRRCRAANILARFPGPATRAALLEALSIPDKTVRTAVLDALIKGEFIFEVDDERNKLYQLLIQELNDAKHILSCIVTFLPEQHSDRLVQALNQEIGQIRKRLLSILTLLSDKRETADPIFYWYIYQNNREIPETVTEALKELLEFIRDSGTRAKAFSLFQYRDPRQVKRLLGKNPPRNYNKIDQRLREIAFGDSPVFTRSWSRICALEMIVNLKLPYCTPQIEEKLKPEEEPFVRATATWALFKLDPVGYTRHAGRLKNDAHHLVSRTAKQLEKELSADPQVSEAEIELKPKQLSG